MTSFVERVQKTSRHSREKMKTSEKKNKSPSLLSPLPGVQRRRSSRGPASPRCIRRSVFPRCGSPSRSRSFETRRSSFDLSPNSRSPLALPLLHTAAQYYSRVSLRLLHQATTRRTPSFAVVVVASLLITRNPLGRPRLQDGFVGRPDTQCATEGCYADDGYVAALFFARESEADSLSHLKPSPAVAPPLLYPSITVSAHHSYYNRTMSSRLPRPTHALLCLRLSISAIPLFRRVGDAQQGRPHRTVDLPHPQHGLLGSLLL
jgi:hypothetical protein